MKKNKKGFTLIEALISTAILTIIIVSFFSMIVNVIRVNEKNERDIQSRTILNSITENVTSYIRKNGKVGVIGNNSFFEENIESDTGEIELYIRQIDINDKIEFIDKNNDKIDKTTKDMFKVTIKQTNKEVYDKGPFNEQINRYLYTFNVNVKPQQSSNRYQEVTKKVYGAVG